MARPEKQAHVRQWRGKWYLIFKDYASTPPRERRLSCEALKARTPEARAELIKKYRTDAKIDEVDAIKRGGRLAYDTPLMDGLAAFRKRCDDREAARNANPNARQGLSPKSSRILKRTVYRFERWLGETGNAGLTTGEIDKPTLERFFDDFAAEPTRLGNREGVKRKTATVNQAKRNLRACFRYIESLRPARFPDFASLTPALRPSGSDAEVPMAFSPRQLKRFLAAALEREVPTRQVRIRHRPGTRKRRTFDQPIVQQPATPVSRLFILLALTGMRLGEALQLEWTDVDLKRGRITVRAQKTGRTRILPLVGAPEGQLSVSLLKLLRVWKREANGREFVLPQGELPAPVFPKSAWMLTAKDAHALRIGPQSLRQNFTSYAASIGIPASVVALWQGHTASVAERYYRAQVLERKGDRSIAEAMGLASKCKAMRGNQNQSA